MQYVSLFSGIGGLDLAMDRLGGGCVLQVEWDSFCRSILEERWPDVPRVGDIHEWSFEGITSVDLVVGGFPCQPVSDAGRKLAQDDPRWLWPEFARLIRENRPARVFIENVPGLRSRGLEGVLWDLEEMGYGGAWDFVSAYDVGAPHLRKRLFVLAVRDRDGGFEERTRTAGPNGAALWVTPRSQDGKHATATEYELSRDFGDRGGRGDLLGAVRGYPSPSGHPSDGRRGWPTPGAQDAKWRSTPAVAVARLGSGRTVNLEDAAQLAVAGLWPTPTRRDYKDSGDNVDYAYLATKSRLAGAVVVAGSPASEGPLNPDWVEWLMGFPLGWTRLEVPTDYTDDYGWAEEPPIPRLARGVERRRERLQALGNAVVPMQALAAYLHLCSRLDIDAI